MDLYNEQKLPVSNNRIALLHSNGKDISVINYMNNNLISTLKSRIILLKGFSLNQKDDLLAFGVQNTGYIKTEDQSIIRIWDFKDNYQILVEII